MLIQNGKPPGLVPGSLIAGAAEEDALSPLAELVGELAAKRMLASVGAVGLSSMSAPELASASSVALELAERVVAARSLIDIVTHAKQSECKHSSEVARHVPHWMKRAETEVLLAFALGTRLELKATVLVCKGGASECSVTPRDVFAPLLRLHASAFVLVHNHPSQTLAPSREDVALTNRVFRLGHDLGVRLLDHLIVTTTGVLSFCDAGLMPTLRELPDRAEAAPAGCSEAEGGASCSARKG